MHCPRPLRDELHRALQAIYPAGVIDVKKGTYISKPHSSGCWGSTFNYVIRHMSQPAFIMLGRKAWRASQRDPETGRHVGIKAPLTGKRWGCTRNLSQRAVNAYWNKPRRLITVDNGSAGVA